MFVEHPEFSDILVDINTYKTVASRDRVNDYFYENNENIRAFLLFWQAARQQFKVIKKTASTLLL